MKHDRIDKLLQLAYLEGKIDTHKAYERAVQARAITARASDASRYSLVGSLEQALEHRAQQEVPLTIGAFLKGARASRSLKAQEVFARIGITHNIYRMLEEDRISPLRISVESWKRLRTLFHLSMDESIEMIRRTHQLVFFRSAFRTTLARYDKRTNGAIKAASLEKAATELYTRAKLPLPADEIAKLDQLIRRLRNDRVSQS
jgi:transcriptional regulator with XRE-family HTH domain